MSNPNPNSVWGVGVVRVQKQVSSGESEWDSQTENSEDVGVSDDVGVET